MKKVIYVLSVLFLLVLFVGCDKKEDYKIELDSNATTGYAWVYKMSEEGIVEETKSEYVAPDSELDGAGGKQIFAFKALKEGEVVLTFTYERSFEENSVVETKIYVLTVDKDLNITEDKEKGLELSQPDVMEDAISVTDFKYSKNLWNYSGSGNYENKTSYKFSKVVITYDALGRGGDDDCGDIVVEINDVEALKKDSFSFKDKAITHVTCQYEYDRLVLKNIKAYK